MLYTVFGLDHSLVEELGSYTNEDDAYKRADRALWGEEQWPEVEVRREPLPDWYK